jgi:long-chain acyl-CoA synthetase
MYHAHGFGNCLMAALMTGARLVILTQEFSPRTAVRSLEAFGVSIYPAVPFMFKMIVDTRFKTAPNLDMIRLLVSAGAKLPQEVSESFLRKFEKPICQLYGSTETGAVCINLRHPADKNSSVGRPLNGMSVNILDEMGQQLPPNNEGEIWISSPAMTHQYDELPEATKECFMENRFFAGDLGYLDEEGDLFVTGRKKLMINVAGYKVDPLEIEQVLKSHPAVEDAVVIGVTDQHYGEMMKAVVVCASGGQCDEDVLIAHAATQLAEYKVPKVIEFRSEIPYSPLGKVLRKYL